MYAETRADDLVITCIRELLRRNPSLPPERVDEVAIAATTQIGDQGLTIGRTAALLAGLPQQRPRLRDRPDVRRRDDRGDHHRRPASPSAPTTSPSPAASSTWAATRWARASTRTRASSPRSSSTPTRSSWARPPRTCTTASRSITKERADAYAVAQPGQARQGVRATARSSPTSSRSPPARRGRAGAWPPHDEPPRPGTTMEDLAALKTPFRPHGSVTAGNAAGLNDGATAVPPRRRGDRRASSACRSGCGWSSFSFVGVEPEVMGVGPIPATEKALGKAGPDHRRHRPLRAQRGVRRAGARLPRALRHRRRRPARQPVRRRHRASATRSPPPACA